MEPRDMEPRDMSPRTTVTRRAVWMPRIMVTSLLAWLTSVPPAHACAVCFGNSDDPIVKGVEMSVLLMLVLTYGLMVGGGVAFFVRRHRSLKRQGPASR